jgi:putative DNA primase/helicase
VPSADHHSPSLLEAALTYARRGWPVFPCSPKNKRPLLAKDHDEAGKPIKNSGGVTKATCDEDLISGWWKKWPQAMVGVAVGRGNLIVIDFDPRIDRVIDKESGEVISEKEWTVAELRERLQEMMGSVLPDTVTVRTPSGGEHLYFLMPAGEPIGNRGNLPLHVDVRGLGGYVIAPPSVCFGDGKNTPGPYRWLRGVDEIEIAPLPLDLERILRDTPREGAPDIADAAAERPRIDIDAQADRYRRWALTALQGEVDELAATPKGGGRHGGRNQGAYMAAYTLGGIVAHGLLGEEEVRGALLAVIRSFDPTAYQSHAQAIDNGLANGQAKPRDLSAVGANMTRGRGSDRSASSLSDRPPSPPIEAYDDYTRIDGPAPHDGDDVEGRLQNGTPSDANPAQGSGGRIRVKPDASADRECAFYQMTDLGNAERFRRRFGDQFRFCKELGWFWWDERRWSLLSEEKDKIPGEVMQAVFETIRAIRNEADLVEASGLKEDDDQDDTRLDFIVRWKGAGDNKQPIYYSDMLRDHAKSSEGANRLGCIGGLAKSFPEISIRADAMDADRMAINVLNGTLRMDLAGNRVVMRLDKHRRDDLISKIANVTYDPDATCEAFDGFLSTVQPKDSNRRFLAQWHGLSLTGDINEQKLAFYHGKGRNGKSTLVDVCGHVAGDYGASIAIESFLDQGRGRKGGEATPDIATLPGIRFLRTSEPEKGAKLAEALIKLITGGEAITARHLNKGFFSFLPSFKVTISGNHKPKITGHDDGIWRRVMLVPWAVQIAKEDVDRALPDKLRGEASGIFNWLLSGLVDWRENGLVEPDDVLDATRRYREDSDQLGRFLEECVEEEEGARSKSSELHALFNAWSKVSGAGEWTQVGFTKAMQDRGYQTKQSNGMQWLGIRMVRSTSDFEDHVVRDDVDSAPPRGRWAEDDDIPV